MRAISSLKYFLRSVLNYHNQSNKKNILLFATARGGSTWLMEIIASQPGMKYFDEPFNIRRENIRKTHVFTTYDELMPDNGNNETIINYFHDLQDNKYRFLNPTPFRKNHSLFTNRIVFKIHELEHMINAIKENCNGQVLYLLRHPIPTTISRHTYPRLELFVNSKYYQENILSTEQFVEIKNIINKGDNFLTGIVSWCYENIVPLKHSNTDDWLIITYEELLLNPLKMSRLLSNKLELPNSKKILQAIGQPASNILLSNESTIEIMKESDDNKRNVALIKKWRPKISQEKEKEAMEILKLFGLDVYEYGRFIATNKYLQFNDTANLID